MCNCHGSCFFYILGLMKRIYCILFVFVIFSACKSPVNNNDEAAILKVLNTQANEWNKGNIEGYMQGYWNNDSLLFIGRRGPKYGYTTTLESYKNGYPDAAAMGTLKFSDIKLKKLSDEYYYVTGGWRLEREDNPGGYFTLLFRKISNKWVIVADHTS